MSTNLELLPVLDTEVLKAKAQDSAMKGALKTIEEYYTAWDSPFKKHIEEELKKAPIGHGIELPDIIGLINQSLVAQIDQIANTAIAQTFVPLVSKFLTRADPEVPFSQILKEFIALFEYEDVDPYDFSINIEEEPRWGWLTIKLSCKRVDHCFTLHKNDSKDKNVTAKTYSALSLPHSSGTASHKMKIKVDGTELEMPFTPDILRDGFISFMARLVISQSIITMDVTDFDDNLFPERCHCH
jgi:hypothetical protein